MVTTESIRATARGCALAIACVGLAAGMVACTADYGANPTPRCTEDVDCDGVHCYRGFCVGEGGGGPCTMEGASIACSARGPDGLTPRGECHPGTQTCRDGMFTACADEARPAASDQCDGRDEDCDGMTDEDPLGACDTGASGICGEGAAICAGGVLRCVTVNQPDLESCNGRDDDCDDMTDESLTRACYPAGEMGCDDNGEEGFDCVGQCTAGQSRCVDGSDTGCVGAVIPVEEACGTSPAADEDCDGNIDEGCPCGTAGSTQPCYGGPPDTEARAPCHAGTQTCDGTSWGACMGAVTPMAETCANQGEDDDCNGMADDIPGLGGGCAGTLPGVCAVGVRACNAEVPSRLVCNTPSAADMEACDTRDDDCDGSVDEAFDLTSDRLHCGDCSVACSTGFDCCGATCVDARVDEMNCGACGRSCSGSADTCCGSACVDTDTSIQHCGACNNACGDGQACCDGTCVSTTSSAANCGMCGRACGPTESCCGGTCAAPDSSVCQGCTPACGAGQICCSGSCVDPMMDEANCGGCNTMGGATCTGSQVCCGGTCGAPDNHDRCGASCAACGASDLCCSGSCVPIDNSHCNACTVMCSTGSCCATGCVDLQMDGAHCGTCANNCPSGQSCSVGHCCPTAQTWCPMAGPSGTGACVNLTNDNDNCATCGHRCLFPLGNCSGRTCGL